MKANSGCLSGGDDYAYTVDKRERAPGIGSDRRSSMLILTRRVGETLMIGDDITVTVLGVKGNQVRVGVNAPREVAVHREEIYERIQKERNGDSEVRPPPGS